MNTCLSIFRPCFAWCLLLAVSYQQLVGRAYVSNVYSMEIEQRMSPHEIVIATMLKAKTGVEVQVTFLGTPDKQRLLYRPGYSAPLIFSKKIDGDEYCFVIGQQPLKAMHYDCPAKNQQATSNLPNNMILLVKLFPDYCFERLQNRLAVPDDKFTSGLFANLAAATQAGRSVPVPPPWLS